MPQPKTGKNTVCIMKKPEWARKQPDGLEFKVVNDPLERVANHIMQRLEHEAQKRQDFHFVLWGLLSTCFETYKAIRKLVGDDPKYPMQAQVLGRSMIDAFFNVATLLEKPAELWLEI